MIRKIKRKGLQVAEEARSTIEKEKEQVEQEVGGRDRLITVAILAGVLGLDTADKATVSAVATGLKEAFDVGNGAIGILVSMVSFIGAATTLPVGVLVDRMRRKRILIVAISIWGLAMLASGTATSYFYLLVTRTFLGAVTAAATPTVASLMGDFFPSHQRARIYGLVLAGELIGTGGGFLVAGELSSWLNWRWAFFAMVIPSAVLVWAVWRHLPEPERGCQAWLSDGEGQDGEPQAAEGHGERPESVQQAIGDSGARPHQELVLHDDPTGRSLWWAVRYLSRVRTFVLLVTASALGYFYFSGVRTYVMIYLTQHYGISRSAVSALIIVPGLGALAGVVMGGRISEWLLRRHHFSARVIVPGVALLLSALLLVPAIVTTSVAYGIGLITLGAAALAAANPGLDAARLDIVHPRLWGRAESYRSTARLTMEAIAPTLFGFASAYWFGGGEYGLMWTFLVMLIALVVASALAIPASRTYPRDVATAAASVQGVSEHH